MSKGVLGSAVLLIGVFCAACGSTGEPNAASTERQASTESALTGSTTSTTFSCNGDADCQAPAQYCQLLREFGGGQKGVCAPTPPTCIHFPTCGCDLHFMDCPPGNVYCTQAGPEGQDITISCQDI
jgi:hypothetical protein